MTHDTCHVARSTEHRAKGPAGYRMLFNYHAMSAGSMLLDFGGAQMSDSLANIRMSVSSLRL